MVKVTFPDGNSKEYEGAVSALDVCKSISKSLAKEALCATINGKVSDMTTTIDADATVAFHKFDDKEGKEVYWHSSAHILAYAVKRLFPDVKIAIGPSIDQGFYYDFETEPFTDKDLAKIEKEMAKIIKYGDVFERKVVSKEEALELFEKEGEIYKVELIKDLPEEEEISLYTVGNFTDLCRGPHLPATSKVKHVKLLATSGAYWRGDSNNTMLQRIYGITFPDKDELEKFLKFREEAEKRDHRKLGKALRLFSFHTEAPGCPFYNNNGVIVQNKMVEYLRYEIGRDGYIEIKTPLLANKMLWETSGHWENYRENMFVSEVENETYVIKPMNCPGGMLFYKERPYSYKELPLKVAELGHVHRNEYSGALSGLFRVRSIQMDDAHIFMTPEQMEDEIFGVIKLLDRIYSTYGLDYHFELSTRPEKSIGSDKAWEESTSALRNALEKCGRGYKLNEGDGAFYGPKIDVKVHDALNREWQCGTIQLDMNLPERFDLNYIDENSDKKRVVMIHRAIYGSLERFMGILIEHFGGFFPLWMTPVQVSVIPVSEKFEDFAKEVYEKLNAAGIRVEFDNRSEKVGYKIREADFERKIPYMLVIGEKEVTTGKFTVRQHKKGDIGELTFDEFLNKINDEIKTKKLPEGYGVED